MNMISLLFNALHAAAVARNSGDVHKNMYTELSRVVYSYCQCRNKERAWSTPPKACVGFRGLPRKTPPRVSVSILTYLPAAVSRLKDTVCHYAAMTDVVDAILIQWNNNEFKAPYLGNCINLAKSNDTWRCLFCIRRKDLARAGTTESFALAWPWLGLAVFGLALA